MRRKRKGIQPWKTTIDQEGIMHVDARVRALLEMTRRNDLFDTHTEEHAALEAFREPPARPRIQV